MKNLLSVLALSLIVFSATSQKYGISSDFDQPEGLAVGSVAPDFKGVDQNGKSISLNDQLKNGPVVLIFYRGYWCGVCSKHLGEFQASLSSITNKGATVIAITPENNDGVSKTVEKTNLEFSVLSDGNYSIMDKYDVRFLVTESYNNKIKTFKGIGIDVNNSDDKPYLPIPATYIIGKDGKIQKVWFDENYKERPTVAEIAKYL